MTAEQTFDRVDEAATVRVPSDWLTPGRFALALALLLCAVFPEVLLGTQAFTFRDFGVFGYPNASYHRECFWRGEIPLWNPLNNCGIPFLAQWNTQTLYPLSLVYLLLPLPWSLNLFCLLHIFLAGMGMFFLASRWTGCQVAAAAAGLAFAFGGLTLTTLIWPNILSVLAWMPWVIAAVEQGWKCGGAKLWTGALVAAMQMLAGMPEYALFTWMLLVALWAADKPTLKTLGRFAGMVSLVTGLIAAQLLPFLELLVASRRNVMFDPTLWSMPLWGWANFLVPLFHCYRNPQGVYFPELQTLVTSYYVALPALVTGACALVWVRDRRVWLLAAASGLGVALAFGKGSYFYGWLLELCPALAFMRYPIKFVALPAFALPLLAAFGIAHWRSRLAGSKRSRALWIILGAVAALVAGILLYAHSHPRPYDDWPATFRNGLWRLAFLAIAVTALVASQRENRQQRALGAVMLLAAIALDSLTQVPRHNPTVSPEAYTRGVIATRISVPKPDEGRAMLGRATHDMLYSTALPDMFDDLVGRRASLFGNCNLMENIATPDGFYAMYLPAQREVWTELYVAPPERFPDGLADFLMLRYLTAPTNAIQWRQRLTAMPLITAGQAPQHLNKETMLSRLVERSFEPRKVVYLPHEAKQALTVASQTDARILSTRFEAGKVGCIIEANEPSLVVISQANYRPWRAFVDGTRTQIWTANYAFQAVQVPAGRHTLKLVYVDRAFQVGAVISTLTGGMFLVAWFHSGRARRKPELP